MPDDDASEVATEKLFVMASPEIVAELLRGWSQPVQLRGQRAGDGRIDLQVRAVPRAPVDEPLVG